MGGTLGIVCKHKKYGTLLYYKNGDILRALSKALGITQYTKRSENALREDYSEVVKSVSHPRSKEELTDKDILQACMALNSKINQQINSVIKHYQKDPLLCARFSPEALIKQLDPLLIQCIQALTKPVQQRRRLFSHQEPLETSGTVQSKTIKQLYCLSTIFFCTNPQCNMPLHYLLSDAILCLGGGLN